MLFQRLTLILIEYVTVFNRKHKRCPTIVDNTEMALIKSLFSGKGTWLFVPLSQGLKIVGVKGLNQCQRRWWKHVSPQRELEIQTSTENTAPDMQMSLCLLTDGSKRNLTRGPRLPKRDRQKTEGEIEGDRGGLGEFRKPLGLP